MKKINVLLITLLIFLAGKTFSQQYEVFYAYDASGNRVEREIIFTPPPIKNSQDSTTQTASMDSTQTDSIAKSKPEYYDSMKDALLKIYPNPTQGNLFLEICDYNFETSVEIQLFDNTGKLKASKTISTMEKTPIDMSSMPAGIYFLRVKLKDDIRNWKIVKL